MDIVQIAAIRAGIYTSSQESQADSHQESEADSQQESQDDFVQDLAFERPTTLNISYLNVVREKLYLSDISPAWIR